MNCLLPLQKRILELNWKLKDGGFDMTFTITRRDAVLSIGSLTAMVGLPNVIMAEGHTVHEIMMYNKDPEDSKKKMIFSPLLLKINAGDTVRFVSAQKGHFSQSIKKMIPDGAGHWKGKMSKDMEVTLSVPGFYGYQCTPHAASGMVGLIVVEGDGKLDNLASAKKVKHRGKAKSVFKKIWEEAEAAGMTS